VDSRKLILAVTLDQGSTKKTQERRALYANRTDIYGNRILGCAAQLEKPGGKRKLQEKDQETEQGKTR
jgi:hypothetical protein